MNDKCTGLIADLLLDQTFVAGIGNKYKSEILFLSKINPFVTVKDIPSKVMKTLLRQIPSILRIGYMNAGMTRDLYKEPIGEMANTTITNKSGVIGIGSSGEVEDHAGNV